MTSGHFIDRLQTGLWQENPGLVQLLGLCPLLAVTSTFINGLGLGVATLMAQRRDEMAGTLKLVFQPDESIGEKFPSDRRGQPGVTLDVPVQPQVSSPDDFHPDS